MVEKCCEVCGDTYDVKPSKAHQSRFCGRACQGEANRQRRQLQCEFCGEQYEVKQSAAEASRFCSRDCKDAHRKSEAAFNPHGPEAYRDAICSWCGSRMEIPRHIFQGQDDFFCTRECHREWMSDTNSGSGNPNWLGGARDGFGDGWVEIRRQIRERDEVCQRCGSEGTETPLDVHHIVPRRAFEDVNDANTRLNLVLLCRRCHKKAEHGTIACPHPEVTLSLPYEMRRFLKVIGLAL